ncbi:MAG: DNA mismatch repair protein MutS [Bacteroidota bacterium]|jgi:DNA mismatch repair protein MutS
MSKQSDAVETPLMKQYNQIKAKYPGALLLFRVGDFYETFGEDAIAASRILGIVLTKRANGSASHIELAGFPHHSLDTYLPKLVRAGQRVAICDQLEDPKLTKKIVKRGVTELITPGVSYNDKILEHKSNNYLASLHISEHVFGVAFIDISTGEFLVAQGDYDYIEKLIHGFKPAEVIFSRQLDKSVASKLTESKFYTFQLDDWVYKYDYAYEKLLKHFGTLNLKGFGVQDLPVAIVAAGAAIHYLHETHHDNVGHIQSVSRIDEEKYVWLDQFTIRNLELLSSSHHLGKSLLDVLDKTVTPMGGRLLRRWVVMPLKEISRIQERHDFVSYAVQHESIRTELLESMKSMGDLERLVSKVAMRRVSPRELQHLNRALKLVPQLKNRLQQSGNQAADKLSGQLINCDWVTNELDNMLVEEPPAAVNKGQVIRSGYNQELDELRSIAFSGKDYLLKIQTEEQQRTGISSLKVAYNNVFGYYLEVTHTHKHKVPPEWVRKQTLTNAERYITEELKQYEEKILGAEEKIASLEERIFNELVIRIGDYVSQIQQNAITLAHIDCLLSFSEVADKYKYCRPVLNDTTRLMLNEARHPVIEQQLPLGESYIPNDIYLDQETQQVIILTGPNMSGKSAVLRQTALISILAQIGSFVPAKQAEIGIIDKIFTRVGASDNISSGESTFMVEMTETASILNNLSERSLIILDEIGRGTSTYDGVSIAWAIAEYLHHHPNRPKTLFATHYHELNELEHMHQRIKNYHIAVQETSERILFLRKLSQGASEHSFGIHVAKMAGVPQLVSKRAGEILAELEHQRKSIGDVTVSGAAKAAPIQLSMFQLSDPAFDKIKTDLQTMDLNTLTPIEALMKLNEWRKMLKY